MEKDKEIVDKMRFESQKAEELEKIKKNMFFKRSFSLPNFN